MLNLDTTQEYQPGCRIAGEGPSARIAISGAWTLAAIEDAHRALQGMGGSGAQEIDLAGLLHLDTAGALALVSLRNTTGGAAQFVNVRTEHRILLDEVSRAASALGEVDRKPSR